MAELKPCPFCGSKELSEAQHKQHGMSLRYTIKCLVCMGEMTRTTKQKAEKAWNNRVANTPCDLCRFNPPSCFDGKPCTLCVAEGRADDGK